MTDEQRDEDGRPCGRLTTPPIAHEPVCSILLTL